MRAMVAVDPCWGWFEVVKKSLSVFRNASFKAFMTIQSSFSFKEKLLILRVRGCPPLLMSEI